MVLPNKFVAELEAELCTEENDQLNLKFIPVALKIYSSIWAENHLLALPYGLCLCVDCEPQHPGFMSVWGPLWDVIPFSFTSFPVITLHLSKFPTI